MTTASFPFHAVVDQDEAKLALTLVAVDSRIGGVLLRGQKGSAKTTLARGLAAVIGDGPFVELPLGATEDRLVGTLDAAAALNGTGIQFRPGLLAEAHGGVLYVDEINLLADHLIDTLLDVTVSGVNVVERDGISHRHPARFVLIGSMNPEEGELRPQLLDRFGLCVEVTAPMAVDARVEAVRRRLSFDGASLAETADAGAKDDDDLRRSIEAACPAVIPDDVLHAASGLAVEVGAEGLRADLTLCRSAAALASLEGRDVATTDDLRRVAALVLAHRSRRGPFDPPTMDPADLDAALDAVLGDEDPADATPDAMPDAAPERSPGPPADGGGPNPGGERPLGHGTSRIVTVPKARPVAVPRGRHVRDVSVAGGGALSLGATVRAVVTRHASGDARPPGPGDFSAEVRVAPARRTIVVCVDLSGSMGARARAEAAAGTVLGLLTDAYQQRDQVALVGFRGADAEVLLAPTGSVEVARNRLGDLPTGGGTPLAAGIARGLDVARSVPADEEALLVLLTDGRATGTATAFADALTAAAVVRARGVSGLVLDGETGTVRLGLAAQIADAMGARYLHVDDLQGASLAAGVRSATGR